MNMTLDRLSCLHNAVCALMFVVCFWMAFISYSQGISMAIGRMMQYQGNNNITQGSEKPGFIKAKPSRFLGIYWFLGFYHRFFCRAAGRCAVRLTSNRNNVTIVT